MTMKQEENHLQDISSKRRIKNVKIIIPGTIFHYFDLLAIGTCSKQGQVKRKGVQTGLNVVEVEKALLERLYGNKIYEFNPCHG